MSRWVEQLLILRNLLVPFQQRAPQDPQLADVRLLFHKLSRLLAVLLRGEVQLALEGLEVRLRCRQFLVQFGSLPRATVQVGALSDCAPRSGNSPSCSPAQ